MRNKSVVMLCIALACGMVASVGISQVVLSGGGASGPMAEILVASQDIPSNSKITADLIMLEKWPEDKIPQGALTDIQALKDKFAKQYVYAGEALLSQKLVDATERATVGIPPGHTVVTYGISGDAGIANLIEPGDRVNVIGFFEKSDVCPETTHKDVFRNVLVFAVDGRTTRDMESTQRTTPSSILLLISKEDEPVWNWAKKIGSLQLTLGNPNEPVNQNEPNAAGQDFMKWLEEFADDRRISSLDTTGTQTRVRKGEGEIITMLTPSGYKRYRWNASNRTMELVGQQIAGGYDASASDSSDAPIGAPLDR